MSVPHEIRMFPLNIILHGRLLPADPTCPGLHMQTHTGLQMGGISPLSAHLHTPTMKYTQTGPHMMKLMGSSIFWLAQHLETVTKIKTVKSVCGGLP